MHFVWCERASQLTGQHKVDARFALPDAVKGRVFPNPSKIINKTIVYFGSEMRDLPERSSGAARSSANVYPIDGPVQMLR